MKTDKPNGALSEAMEIMKGSLADNSMIAPPYRAKGKIILDRNKEIHVIYINGIYVDFEIVRPSDKFLIKIGEISSLDWDGKERNYSDF